MGGDNVENFDANAGTNKLANVLSDRMRRENDTSLCLDFGEIQETAASSQILSQ